MLVLCQVDQGQNYFSRYNLSFDLFLKLVSLALFSGM